MTRASSCVVALLLLVAGAACDGRGESTLSRSIGLLDSEQGLVVVFDGCDGERVQSVELGGGTDESARALVIAMPVEAVESFDLDFLNPVGFEFDRGESELAGLESPLFVRIQTSAGLARARFAHRPNPGKVLYTRSGRFADGFINIDEEEFHERAASAC